jgi:hypothetical protein
MELLKACKKHQQKSAPFTRGQWISVQQAEGRGRLGVRGHDVLGRMGGSLVSR